MQMPQSLSKSWQAHHVPDAILDVTSDPGAMAIQTKITHGGVGKLPSAWQVSDGGMQAGRAGKLLRRLIVIRQPAVGAASATSQAARCDARCESR
jgi:hypothetical protein